MKYKAIYYRDSAGIILEFKKRQDRGTSIGTGGMRLVDWTRAEVVLMIKYRGDPMAYYPITRREYKRLERKYNRRMK